MKCLLGGCLVVYLMDLRNLISKTSPCPIVRFLGNITYIYIFFYFNRTICKQRNEDTDQTSHNEASNPGLR